MRKIKVKKPLFRKVLVSLKATNKFDGLISDRDIEDEENERIEKRVAVTDPFAEIYQMLIDLDSEGRHRPSDHEDNL